MSACDRHKDRPEGVEWSPEDSLDHFLHCLELPQQLNHWLHLRASAGMGDYCWEADHQRRLEANGQYTAKLLFGIREAIGRLDGAEYGEVLDVRAKLQELIS